MKRRKCFSMFLHQNLTYSVFRIQQLSCSILQVSSQIVKLVLRNNALTTLRGIQNLKSLEGLDVSYNIISNFSEIEILAGLPSLRILWLEGNPLCCARWYRAQIFSYFPYAENVSDPYSFICGIFSLSCLAEITCYHLVNHIGLQTHLYTED